MELLEFEGIGTLEAFLTDGLRTLVRTIEAPDMIEKTLRYPGHAEKMALLRDTGFLSEEPIEIEGREIRPIDLAKALLFPMWELKEGEEDLTVMRVEVEGTAEGKKLKRTYDLVDRYDRATRTTSMARTTGYAATMAVRLLANGLWQEPGIAPPELLGRDPTRVEFVLDGLRERGIDVRETAAPIG